MLNGGKKKIADRKKENGISRNCGRGTELIGL